MNLNWECPYCNRSSTITDANFSQSTHFFHNKNKDGHSALVSDVITCPNKECREYTITAALSSADLNHNGTQYVKAYSHRHKWSMKPNSLAKQFPSYIPKAIIADYNEASLIISLSPKASATLSRRCLQGIIRDYWDVKKGRLVDEIFAIKDKVDPITWKAIDSVRSIGNIGAHMEKDINLIIDVEPREAQLLIGLIEMLIKEWYVAGHERQKQLEAIIGVAGAKSDEKKANKVVQ